MSSEPTRGRAMRPTRRRSRPPLLRTRHVPPDAATRTDIVRALTKTILRLSAHLRAQPAHRRDRKTTRSLECAINERGVILELLRTEQPIVFNILREELRLEPPSH